LSLEINVTLFQTREQITILKNHLNDFEQTFLLLIFRWKLWSKIWLATHSKNKLVWYRYTSW